MKSDPNLSVRRGAADLLKDLVGSLSGLELYAAASIGLRGNRTEDGYIRRSVAEALRGAIPKEPDDELVDIL